MQIFISKYTKIESETALKRETARSNRFKSAHSHLRNSGTMIALLNSWRSLYDSWDVEKNNLKGTVHLFR